MAEQIREKQFNVQQAAQVATEGSAYDDSGVRLAQSLQSLVSDAGQFGQQISGMYATGKQQDLQTAQQRAKVQKGIDETKAYDEISEGLKNDPKFLSKHDELPLGWTEVKWTAYNTLKGNADAASLTLKLDEARENYLKSVANDPNKVFIQGELDTVYQNTFDQMLRTSNGSGAWMQTFLPKATTALNNRSTADRADIAKRTQASFEEKANNSILSAISNFDFSSVTPDVQQQANAYFIYSEGEKATASDTLNYGRAVQISNAYQENRQLRKDLGLPVDKDSMVKVFKQLASQPDDLTPVMEVLLDMEMPGTGLTYGESGQRVELLKVLEDSKEDVSETNNTLIHNNVINSVKTFTTQTSEALKEIHQATDKTGFIAFRDSLRNQNEKLNKLRIDINDVDPESRTRLQTIINDKLEYNNLLLSKSRGIYFAETTDSFKLPEIYKGRMLGKITLSEMFTQYRQYLTQEDFNNFSFLEDEMLRANNAVVKGFLNLLGVDPGGRTYEEIISSKFFKPDSPEAIALNSFVEKIAMEGPERLLKYYNEFGVDGKTVEQKLYGDTYIKDTLLKPVFEARKLAIVTKETNKTSYDNDPIVFVKNAKTEDMRILFDGMTVEQKIKFVENLAEAGYNPDSTIFQEFNLRLQQVNF